MPVSPPLAAFRTFQASPLETMRVAARRLRAQQLRALLDKPGTVDVATFHKEVWRYESQVLLDTEDITGQLFDRELSAERIATLQEAITQERLEIHGNLAWKPATSVFAPRARSDRDRQKHIDSAIGILNREDLDPAATAQELLGVHGLGPGTATGLVMLFHPTEFALQNIKSVPALQSLGYDTGSAEAFQKSARTLKDTLGAEDFIELDWFLYLYSAGRISDREEPQYWWVCQGATYRLEREGEFIWAPEVTRSGRSVAHHEAVGKVRAGDLIVHYAGKAIRAIGIAREAATTSPQPLSLRGSAREEEGHYVSVEYFVLDSPIALEAIPRQWRARTPDGPFNQHGDVNPGYLFRMPAELADHLRTEFSENLRGTPLSNEAALTTTTTKPTLVREPQEQYGNRDSRETEAPTRYREPTFEEIYTRIAALQLRISRRLLLRYHLSLKTRSFVILAGPSGTGKTWLGEAYARAVGAQALVVPVAPNWTTNEDLLGYQNPISGAYHDTALSQFLRAAGAAFTKAQQHGAPPQPYHLILDEMNLARVEYYFARFLSAMEQRARSASGVAAIELAPGDSIVLPPNLIFVGTVNMDETTHGFADKVFDRAQLIELEMTRSMLIEHLGETSCAEALLAVWDAVGAVAPFAFRVVDEIIAYLRSAEAYGVDWEHAFDEQVLQKILPKLKGADPQVGDALRQLVSLTEERFPLSHEKASRMLAQYTTHGIASYF